MMVGMSLPDPILLRLGSPGQVEMLRVTWLMQRD